MSNISDLKYKASGQWISILQALAPQLNKACERPGRHVPCPTHGGKDGFRLFNDVEQTGGGICNTCGAFADGLDLLQWVNGWTLFEAVGTVKRFLGMGTGMSPSLNSTQTPAPTSGKNWESKRKWLQMIWDEAIPNHPRLKQYLEYRGLSIDPPPSLRLHEGLKYLDDQKRSLGKFPCMVAEIVRGSDVVGLHVTFFDTEGPGKAIVPTPKKIWKCTDSISGGSIHLFDTHLEPNKPLALAEGVESALAIKELTGIPVWACGNAVLLERVEVHGAVDTVYIGADKDRSGTGEIASHNLADRLFRKGVNPKVSFPPMEIPEGKKSVDWMDYLAQGQEVKHG